jgi:hypothetical protein
MATIEAMFVQTAQAMSSVDRQLTLIGLADSTLYFSDRPARIVGHVTSSQFLDLWTEGENSFAADPPNAVLSFLAPDDGEPAEVVMVLHDPTLRRDRFGYRVKVLDGTLPAVAGACALFIDPMGLSLSPASVSGVHRGSRRHGSARRSAQPA